MALGGINAGWDNTLPAASENLGLGPGRITSMKTALQELLNSEHNFPTTGGAATGYHLYGSARPFVGTQSVVSSSGTDGRIMYTSDSSRLFGVGSEGTVLLGDSQLLSVGTTTGISRPQRAYWALEMGATQIIASGTVTIPNSGFSGLPFVIASVSTPSLTEARAYDSWVSAIDGSSFAVQVRVHVGSNAPVNAESLLVNWISIGTRAL